MTVTFAALRAANLARLPQFKNRRGEPAHSEADGSDWSPADWMVATMGELGEAANLMKKLRRGDFAADEEAAARAELEREFADVAIYLDIMAFRHGVDLGEAVLAKFNLVSQRVGADVWLARTEESSEAVARADTASIQRDALASSLHLSQFATANLNAELTKARKLLGEAGRQFRFYEEQHHAKGPAGAEKAKVNADFAARIEDLLGRVVRTQGEGGGKAAAPDPGFQAWAQGDDGGFGPDGAPDIQMAMGAIQTWAICQGRAFVPVAEAAAAFRVTSAMIREAVEAHPWMFIGSRDGVETIEHEGD